MRDTETLWTARLDADTRTLTVEDREQPRYTGRYRVPAPWLLDVQAIVKHSTDARRRLRYWIDQHGDDLPRPA